jgi:hypothetical protein
MDHESEPVPACYGKLFPPLTDQSYNRVHKGQVFGFLVRSYGLLPSSKEVVVDEKAWEQCVQCPHYRSCYDLSLGRFQVEAAITV